MIKLQSRRAPKSAFTLVELLVVLAIIGALLILLLPAVQYAREASRRSQCKNQLRQSGLALQQFHAVHERFPAGSDDSRHFSHAWVVYLLPHLEQEALYARYQFDTWWGDTSNGAVIRTNLPIMRCPSGTKNFDGDIDYCGMEGSSLTGLPPGTGPGRAWSSGPLITITPTRTDYVSFGQIPDGASQTIIVAESIDREGPTGYWASGWNCLAHENGPINSEQGNGIYSHHGNVAFAAFADGSVQTLTEEMDLYVLGALCTRNGREAIAW